MSRWAAALLSPVLVPQAAWVIARAQRLPEAAGPRVGRAGSGPPLRVLIIGDSSAAGVGVTTQTDALAGQLEQRLSARFTTTWTLIAKTGATTGSTLAHLRTHAPVAADVAVLIHGVNDTTRLVPVATFAADHTALRALLRDTWNVPRLISCAVPPVGHFPLLPWPLRRVLGQHAARLDGALRQVAGPDHLPFDMPMDTRLMAEDGFHPGPRIYSAWADRLAARIEKA